MTILPSIFSSLLASAVYDVGKMGVKNKALEKRYRTAFERAVGRFYSDPRFAGNEARLHYDDYREMLRDAAMEDDILASSNEVYQGLLELFQEEVSSNPVLACHALLKGIFVSQKKISDIDAQLKEDLTIARQNREASRQEHEGISEQISELKELVINQKEDNASQFDINTQELIHVLEDYPFVDESGNCEEKVISWADILKAVACVLRKPHSEAGLIDALKGTFSGIVDDDVTTIIDKLHSFGLAVVLPSNTEFEGASAAWVFSEEGRKAYERAMNYHLQPAFQQRDKDQVIELMIHFSTTVMDEYLREGPDLLNGLLLLSSDCWNHIIRGSAFQIHSQTLRDKVECFNKLFNELTSHGECYEYVESGHYRLVRPSFGEVNKVYDSIIRLLDDSFSRLNEAYHDLIDYIKEHYPDIDLKQTSDQFEREFGRNPFSNRC